MSNYNYSCIIYILNRTNSYLKCAPGLSNDWGSPQGAKRFLKQWSTTALKSRLEPLRKFVYTIRKHTDNILTFIDSRLTNAIAEGLNRIIRIVKNRASGFRTVWAFIDLIYLTIGDVDIPAQIPNKFHTL